MTSDAILVNHSAPFFSDENHLWLISESKNRSMAKTILCFKEVFVNEVIMRYMAIVTIGLLPV
jgi:hypothetical protein